MPAGVRARRATGAWPAHRSAGPHAAGSARPSARNRPAARAAAAGAGAPRPGGAAGRRGSRRHAPAPRDPDEIVELIQSIKNSGAEDALYDWELAKAYVEIESFGDALNSYQEAYTSLQHDSDFLKEYGYFLTEEGRLQEAIPVLKAYLGQQPIDEDVREHVERLEQDLL